MALAATKLRGLSVYKLGGSTLAQGESSDLLNADRDKNDYDWSVIFLFLGSSPLCLMFSFCNVL